MKVMMIFDQTQAGLGGKESPDLPMGGKPMAIGSCGMFQRFMDQNDGKVIATLWCDKVQNVKQLMPRRWYL